MGEAVDNLIALAGHGWGVHVNGYTRRGGIKVKDYWRGAPGSALGRLKNLVDAGPFYPGPLAEQVENDLGFDPDALERFRDRHDEGSGCDDIARAVEERYDIPQVWGQFVMPDGHREPHSWNMEENTVVDASRYVFGGEVDDDLFIGDIRDPKVAKVYTNYSDDPDDWEFMG